MNKNIGSADDILLKRVTSHTTSKKKKARSLDSKLDKNKVLLNKLTELISSRKITNFLRENLIRKNYSLHKRIQFYEYINKHLAHLKINNCLKQQTVTLFNSSQLSIYNIADTIYLTKAFGSSSVYGIVYKADVKNTLGSSPIAAKIMKASIRNKKEIDINKLVTQLVLEKISPHFILSYRSFQCVVKNKSTSHTQKSMSSLLSESYFVCLNERVDGDLQALCSDVTFLKNEDTLMNIACQCMLAIATFHRLGYLHLDTHWGNFLFHKTTPKQGYYHYIIDGVDYFLEDCGYTIMIYDFGKAVNIDTSNLVIADHVKDYKKILNAFCKKEHGGWIENSHLSDDTFSDSIYPFREYLHENSRFYENEQMILNDILTFFSNYIYTSLPSKAKILNSSPYII
jgi:predicted unusual protein kinase regulating ubiquinone biosynthesis (AarF/ABC1/UbiB family)